MTVFLLLFHGIGTLFPWTDDGDDDSIFIRFFGGALLYSTFVNLVQIFIPAGIFIPIALLLLLCLHRPWRESVKSAARRIRSIPLLWKVTLAVFIAYITALSVQHVSHYDHYNYHGQLIRWLKEYRLVPGLANIHHRFGFNNAFMTVSSTQLVPRANDFYSLNGLLFIMSMVWLFKSLSSTRDAFHMVAISGTMVLYFAFSKDYLDNASPDFHVCCFLTVLVHYLLSRPHEKHDTTFILLSIVSLPTLKISLLPFSLIMFVYFLWRHFDRIRPLHWVIPVVVSTVWVSRNSILSGQLLFPSESMYIETFEHRVTRAETVLAEIWIKNFPKYRMTWESDIEAAFEKNPREVIRKYSFSERGFSWVPGFIRYFQIKKLTSIPRFWSTSYLDVLLVALSLSILFFMSSGNRRRDLPLFLMTALLANLAFWFLAAPAWRFGFPILILTIHISAMSSMRLGATRLISTAFLLLTVPSLALHILKTSYWEFKKGNTEWFNPSVDATQGIEKRDESKAYRTDTIYNSDRSAWMTYRLVVADVKVATNSEFPAAPFSLDNVEMSGSEISEGFRVKNHDLIDVGR